MTIRRKGQSSYLVSNVGIMAGAAIGGPMEGQGPIGKYFDRIWEADTPKGSSFEQAERQLLQDAQDAVLEKSGVSWDAVDMVLGGDLLDQIVSTNFDARRHQRPLVGLFAACAVFTEAIGLGALLIEGGGPQKVLASAVSHHLSAERQFRFPIELGYQRAPTAAWTATAAGSVLLTSGIQDLSVSAVTFGRVIDYGLKDPNDMGSAMAPAAVDTIMTHLRDTGRAVSYYDKIFTGDLGKMGVKMAIELAKQDYHTDLTPELDDCGLHLYFIDKQDVHNGASGPGCSASVFSGFLFSQLFNAAWTRILLVSTGALFSPTTYQQGESIPCIAHAVAIERRQSS